MSILKMLNNMSVKILYFFVLYYVFAISCVSCEDEKTMYTFSDIDIDPDINYDINVDIESLITKYQEIEATADNLNRVGITPVDDIEMIYDDMIDVLDDIIESVRNSNNAYKFLKAKGLDRITTSGLKINYDELKTHILILLKVLFGVAPTTTNAVIPVSVIDRLMDIYEKDNLDLKTLSLEVLMLWLPDNPRIQARLMKIKGFVPFYDQVKLLDADAMNLLLELFNKILKEHLIARSEVQRTILDADKLKFYQRIGLLEHMATPTICNGLLNIFSNVWSYESKHIDVVATIFELLKNIKQFCLKVYRGQSKALNLMTALQEFVQVSAKDKIFAKTGINMTDVSLVLEDYIETLKHTVKTEL